MILWETAQNRVLPRFPQENKKALLRPWICFLELFCPVLKEEKFFQGIRAWASKTRANPRYPAVCLARHGSSTMSPPTCTRNGVIPWATATPALLIISQNLIIRRNLARNRIVSRSLLRCATAQEPTALHGMRHGKIPCYSNVLLVPRSRCLATLTPWHLDTLTPWCLGARSRAVNRGVHADKPPPFLSYMSLSKHHVAIAGCPSRLHQGTYARFKRILKRSGGENDFPPT